MRLLPFLLSLLFLLPSSTAITPPSRVATSAPLRPSSGSASSSPSRNPLLESAPPPAPPSQTQTLKTLDAQLTGASRRSFIVRTYTILIAQLLATGLTMALFHAFKPSLLPLLSGEGGRAAYLLSLLVGTGSFYSLLLSRELREGRWRYPLLAAFTAAQSVLLATLTLAFDTGLVVKAAMTTLVAVASITGFTATHRFKRDLSELGTFLFSASVCFLLYQLAHVLSLFGWLPFEVTWNETIGCSLGAALAATYLSFHTKLIFSSPDQKYEFAKTDHVVAALCLYNDIINLFVYVLRLMAEAQRKD